jgi:uncharacterized protein (UPF0147 family)
MYDICPSHLILISSTFRIRPCGMFPVKTNLAVWILEHTWHDSLVGRSVRRKAATYTGQHKQKKRGQTSMPWVRCEPTISVFERAKIFHASDRAVTVSIKKNGWIGPAVEVHRAVRRRGSHIF